VPHRIATTVFAFVLAFPGILPGQHIFSDGFESGDAGSWSDVVSPLPPWLDYLNLFRDLADLPHPGLNDSWSHGCWLHSRYCVENDIIVHQEDPGNPWYTVEGNAAGTSGNVAVSSSVTWPDETFLNSWMTGPFHAVGIIDPQLLQTAFGSYRRSVGTWKSAATLDVLRGLGTLPPGVTFPVYFPKPGGQTWLLSYGGNELPNPLTHSTCTFGAPSGPPIILQLGSGGVTPSVTAHGFLDNGTPEQHCVFDETDYTNPNADYQSLGRSVLNARDAVVLMPRYTLTAGHTYSVSITSNGQTYDWSFTAVAAPPSLSPADAGWHREQTAQPPNPMR
jgi:hypothetical protein